MRASKRLLKACRHRGRRGLALSCALPALLSALAGCGAPVAPATDTQHPFTPGSTQWETPARSSPHSPTPTASGQPSVDPSPTLDPAEAAAVRQVLIHYWSTAQKAAQRPKPTNAQLATYATGGALRNWQTTLGLLTARKQHYRGSVRHAFVVEKVTARSATAADCAATANWLLVDAKGVAHPNPRAVTPYSYRLVKVGKNWKVSTQSIKGKCR